MFDYWSFMMLTLSTSTKMSMFPSMSVCFSICLHVGWLVGLLAGTRKLFKVLPLNWDRGWFSPKNSASLTLDADGQIQKSPQKFFSFSTFKVPTKLTLNVICMFSVKTVRYGMIYQGYWLAFIVANNISAEFKCIYSLFTSCRHHQNIWTFSKFL